MHVINKRVSSFNGFNTVFNHTNGENSVVIPPNIKTSLESTDVSFSVMQYDDDMLFATNQTQTLASGVLAVNVDGVESGEVLDSPVTLTFALSNSTNGSSIICAYWDTSSTSWMTSGCTATDNTTADILVCECLHLTNFAALVDTQGEASTLSATDTKALEFITYIGCSISIFLLGITFYTFARYKVCLRREAS